MPDIQHRPKHGPLAVRSYRLTLILLQWPAMLLVLLLQRAPVLRAVLNVDLGASNRIVQILQGALVAALAAGEVHAQTGATAVSPARGEEGNPGRGTVGEPFQGAVAIIGAPLTAASYRVTGELPPGLQVEGLNNEIFNGIAVPITGTPTEAGEYTIFLRAWNMPNLQGDGGQTEFDFSIIIEPRETVGGPEILASPNSADLAAGAPAMFSVNATGEGDLSYQWYRFRSGESDPAPIAGATAATLGMAAVQAADMGFYFARVTSGETSIDSEVAILTLRGGTSRLANLSTRGSVPANGKLIPGFVIDGTGTKEIMVRAAGPLLRGFGVSAAMEDPGLALVSTAVGEARLENDDWETASNLADLVLASAAVGALPFDPGSKDAAILTSVPLRAQGGSKGYTVEVSATDGAAGIALAEVYDGQVGEGASRLTNVSARGVSGTGEEALIPGFVISGTGAKTMLIRVVGPTLADFGVLGTMVDPRLEVIPGGQAFVIAANDDWGGSAELAAAFAATGAFVFAGEDSRDAAVLVRLPPGAYTVRPTGANSGTGEILVEAYEVID